MQLANRGLAEKIGPGATLIACASALSCSSSALVPGGSSTHSTKPPAGRDTRVPAGKCSAIAALTCCDLGGQLAPQPAEVVLIAAVLDELGDRQLRQRRRRHALRELQLLDLLAEPARRRPPDAVPRRQRLRERRAQHHQPARSNALAGRGRAGPKYRSP
jgi:hypothetical protein